MFRLAERAQHRRRGIQRTERSLGSLGLGASLRLRMCFRRAVRGIPIIPTTRITDLDGAVDCGGVDFIRATRSGVAMATGTVTAADMDIMAVASAAITARI